jgi:hypothetical protein
VGVKTLEDKELPMRGTGAFEEMAERAFVGDGLQKDLNGARGGIERSPHRST